MIIDLVKYLTVAMGLFILGVWGIFLNRKNIIILGFNYRCTKANIRPSWSLIN